jgi:streptogramin lyase
MTKRKLLIGGVVMSFLVMGLMQDRPSAQSTSGTVLMGTIKSASGQALEGMTVTARAQGKTIKTTVFTDEQGEYYFPPLENGTYEIWAQAVGFVTNRGTVQVQGRRTQHDFTMATTTDVAPQLSGIEWLASLPADTPQDARMKEVFRTNCAGCHAASWVLQNRFDKDGWVKIIANMERISIQGGGEQRVDSTPQPWLRYHRDELAEYLAKVRGPSTITDFKILPRPRGEPARAVITEYQTGSSEDLNRPPRFDGSDWSEGIPAAYEARGAHDADVDPQGYVWIVYGDDGHPADRTYGRLDPKTGVIQDFRFRDERGVHGSHGVKVDEQGRVWFDSGGFLQMVDSKDPTLKLNTFRPPQGMGNVGGHIQISPQGYVWATSNGGLMFDPKTQQWRRFDHPWPGGNTYGVGADANGNGWWAQMGGLPYDELGKGDLVSGKSIAVPMEPVPGMRELATPADLEFYRITGSQTNMAPMWAQGPRRMMGDKTGSMWASNWWGNNLAQVDINTHQVKYHYYPNKDHAGLYQPVVDRNGMIWANLMTSDRVTRFDPQTNTWTDFLLPNRGTETRHMAVDNFKDRPEGWTPYWRTNQIARIQLRTPEEIEALKNVR